MPFSWHDDVTIAPEGMFCTLVLTQLQPEGWVDCAKLLAAKLPASEILIPRINFTNFI